MQSQSEVKVISLRLAHTHTHQRAPNSLLLNPSVGFGDIWGHLNFVGNSAVQRYKLGIPAARDTWGAERALPTGPEVAHITPAFLPGRASLILR